MARHGQVSTFGDIYIDELIYLADHLDPALDDYDTTLDDHGTTIDDALEAMSDMSDAINAKEDALPTGTSAQYMRGDKTLGTFPAIPDSQVQCDWNAVSGAGQILNKPTLFSGSYNDLTNKPTIPSTTGLRKVETFLGTTDASGNYTITFANSYATAPDVQPQIVGGGFNQFVRLVSVSTTQAVIQVAQRNTVNLLATEVLLGNTTVVNGANVSVLVTPRS